VALKAKSMRLQKQSITGRVATYLRQTSNRPLVKAIAKVGETVGKLAVFAAIVSWLLEIPSRHQQAYDSAWTLINSANAKRGDGGRSNALQVLAEGRMPLTFVDLTYAIIRKVNLKSTDFSNAKFVDAELNEVSLNCRWTLTKQPCSDLSFADFTGANLINVNFDGADLSSTKFINNPNIIDVKMNNTHMVFTKFINAPIHYIELKNADMHLVTFQKFIFGSFSEKQFEGASLDRVRFLDGEITTSMFSLINGACDVELPNRKMFNFHCVGRSDSEISSDIIRAPRRFRPLRKTGRVQAQD
jgi:uncharacterized protein YjbI with pentapeptide repeats